MIRLESSALVEKDNSPSRSQSWLYLVFILHVREIVVFYSKRNTSIITRLDIDFYAEGRASEIECT